MAEQQVDYNTFNLWALVRKLCYTFEDEHLPIDEAMCKQINKIEDLHHFTYASDVLKNCPKTILKINEIILTHFNNPNKSREYWDEICHVRGGILNNQVKNKLIDYYLSGVHIGYHWYISDIVPKDGDRNVELLSKFIDSYKSNSHRLKGIEKVFLNIKSEEVKQACLLLSKSTAAVQSVLLLRTDIEEEFILKGLKALSKLSSNKTVKTKIKMELLKRLGPKS